ncbi:J domain-containing protein [Streptobacillus felis]|uniref:J domain-containing protein n=1 Tax=Streptobacillus felis TaxID=1384509 RepID=A0A7Z0TCK3_9FUSO|nr:J domain-containing protein [Streptobacillus felis]NYV28403.1 J domain-containing protein [Streptobacillus felis]
MRNIFAILFGLLVMAIFSNNRRDGGSGIVIRIIILIFTLVFFLPFIAFIIFLVLVGYLVMKLTGFKINTYTYTDDDFKNYTRYNNYEQSNGYNNYNNTYTNIKSEYEKACEYLGVKTTDSFDVKKKARNTMLKKYHPDFYQDEKEKERATEVTNKINNAWDIIERYEGVK